jgi:chromosomal replication initiation ATPase DnaA
MRIVYRSKTKDAVIANVLCQLTKLRPEELTAVGQNGKITRKREIVEVRHLTYYFYKEFFPLASLEKISHRALGLDQGHSTVIHAITCVENRLSWDYRFADVVQKLRVLVRAELSNYHDIEITEDMVRAVNMFNNCASL